MLYPERQDNTLSDCALKLYKHPERTLKVPKQELRRATFHYHITPRIDIKFEDGRECTRGGNPWPWPFSSSALANISHFGEFLTRSEFFKGGEIRNLTLYHGIGSKAIPDSGFTQTPKKGTILGTIKTA